MNEKEQAELLAEYGALAAKVAGGDDGEAVMNRLKAIEIELGMSKQEIVAKLMADR